MCPTFIATKHDHETIATRRRLASGGAAMASAAIAATNASRGGKANSETNLKHCAMEWPWCRLPWTNVLHGAELPARSDGPSPSKGPQFGCGAWRGPSGRGGAIRAQIEHN